MEALLAAARVDHSWDGLRARLRDHELALDGLRRDAALLRQGYDALRREATASLKAVKARQLLVSDVDLLTCSNKSTSQRLTPVAPAAARGSWLPYAVLAGAAAAFTFAAPRLQRALASRAAPAASTTAPEVKPVLPIDFSQRADSPVAPIDGEVAPSDADRALALVYGFVPDGRRRAVRELVPAGPALVDKTSDGRFLVTLRPGDDPQAPIYEFEVDPARGSVEPSRETASGLGGAQVAARD